MQNGKRFFSLVVLVLLIVLAFFMFQSLSKNSAKTGVYNKDVNPVESINNTEGESTLSYKDALSLYEDRRIELNTACGAVPDSVTVSNNDSVMIDNRASEDRVIKVGELMNIKAYSFKIIKISSETVPTVWSVDCYKTPAVAKIIIQ